MHYTQVMKQLESLGTAQTRKVYGRHGVGKKMFGVSYANLGKLRKTIRVDQELAQRLWESGNHDARVLATMVADPSQMKSRSLDTWATDLDNYAIADAFATLAAKTPWVTQKTTSWTRSKKEWVGSSGWTLLAHLALAKNDLSNDFFVGHLETIEKSIHGSKNRVRYAMNNALIAIGIRNSALEKKAIGAAKRIGKVEVDHGETGCKTPDAVPYIQKARARKKNS